jgi:hypothetical protein
MKLRTQRRVIYAAMSLTVLSLIGGFALASIQTGSTNTVGQGSQTTTITPVNELMWNSTALGMSSGSFTACTQSSPCNASGTPPPGIQCVGGVPSHTNCVTGDWIEQETLTTVVSQPFPVGGIAITMYVTIGGSTTYTGTTSYYTESSDAAAHNLVMDFDLGNTGTPANVTSITVVINPA